MQINIATRHGHLSEKTQAKISEKVNKLMRFHDRLTSAEVTVDLENEDRPNVEIQLTAERAGRFVASESAPQMMPALDSVLHKLEQQLRKHKEKLTDRHRHGSRRPAVETDEGPE